MIATTDNTRCSSAASIAAKFVVALLIGVSYWSIGNKLDQSVTLREQMEIGFDRAENQYAVQQKETTTSSAVGYFLLGATGIGCWLTAPAGRLRWTSLLFGFALLFIGWAVLSLTWSIEPIQTVRKIAILGLMLLGALGMAAKFDLEDFLEILILVLGSMAAIGLLAELRFGTFMPWKGTYRFCGTMHPNDQGLNCAVLALASWFASDSKLIGPNMRRALMLGGLIGLWLSKSRTTLGALVIAGAVYLILHARGLQRWMVASSCATIVAIAGIVYSFVSVSVIKETANVAEMGRGENISSLTGRLPLWSELWHAATKRPVLGHGFGGFWGEKNILKYSEMEHWHIPHAHNAYLDLILALGAVGLSLYVAWVVATIAYGAVRYERTGRMAHLFVACLAALSLAHGATESKFPGSGLAGFFVLTVMLMEAVQVSAQSVAAASPLTLRRRPMQSRTPHVWPGAAAQRKAWQPK
jgi:O-antigen ligase